MSIGAQTATPQTGAFLDVTSAFAKESFDHEGGNIDFPPLDASVPRVWIAMVVIMPTFTERDHTDEPAIGRLARS